MITEGLRKTNFKNTWNYSGFNEIQATCMTSHNPWAKELRNAKSLGDIMWRLHKKAWTSCQWTEEHWYNLPLHFLSSPLSTFVPVESSSFNKPFILYGGPQLSEPNAHSKFKSFTTNSKHSQQITNDSQQITSHSQQIPITSNQIIDPTRRLQWPTTSGARRLKTFVIHELATLESSRHLVAFSSSSTNENHVLFLLCIYRLP